MRRGIVETPEAYGTIVVDCPWKVNRPNGWGKGTSASTTYMPYKTMKVNALETLPIKALADDICHLYLFTVNRYVHDAYHLAQRWGFAASTLLTWVKQPRGMGPGGHFASTTEFVLFCRRGIEGKNPKTRCPTSWFDWPRGRHSEKPDQFYTTIEEISPAPRLDIFARKLRAGWDVWGDETTSIICQPLDDWSWEHR